MPIQEPGYRPVRSRLHVAQRAKKTIAVTLSLTAMVDLFTVLTVFLLQNYSVTGVPLQLHKEVVLPLAKMSEELTPANVVTVTKEIILVGTEKVADVSDVLNQPKWMIPALKDQLMKEISESMAKAEKSRYGVTPAYRNVTVQADRDVDFAIVKKVMFTATEAGAGEVNFAVLKKTDSREM